MAEGPLPTGMVFNMRLESVLTTVTSFDSEFMT
jgi:hypothetical protein